MHFEIGVREAILNPLTKKQVSSILSAHHFKTMNLQSLTYLEKTGSASEREGKTSLNALANKHMGALAALP